MAAMADKFSTFEPVPTYVPFIMINGKNTDAENDKAALALFDYVCSRAPNKGLGVCKKKPKNYKNRSGANKDATDSKWRKQAAKQRQGKGKGKGKGVNKCKD